jgi:hypothetical protein
MISSESEGFGGLIPQCGSDDSSGDFDRSTSRGRRGGDCSRWVDKREEGMEDSR